MEQVFLSHFARYPELEPQDAVKLLYQASFGGGHLIADEDAAFQRLKAELDATPERDVPAVEPIGHSRVRLQLASPAVRRLPPERVFEAFLRSSRTPQDPDFFRAGLALLRSLTERDCAPFGTAALEAYLGPYEAAGCPMVSHSAGYRAAYAPAYRVLDAAEGLEL